MDQQTPQNPQQPYYQPQQPWGQPQGSSPQQPYYQPQQPQGTPLPPPPQQPYYQPPFNPGQMVQQSQQAPRKNFWQRQSKFGKAGIGCGALLILMAACGLCSSMMNATTSATQTTAQTTTTTKTTATQAPVTPTPTQKPKPTPTPKPTQSPAQKEAAYKAKCANTTVTNIDKMGNGYQGKDLHFTAVIYNFVKDSNGNTAGANVNDTDSSSMIQIGFAPGTDLTKMNEGDTVEVWGQDVGVSSGKNAFGGDIQEAGVVVSFITDQTTGYQK